ASGVATRRWGRADDPGADDGLDLPGEGETFVVKTEDGAELAGVVCGDPVGPTVVLSHCWMGSRSVWAPVARRLCAAGHRVVLYDQRGHGASTTGADVLTVSLLGSDLRAVLDELDIEDAVVAGHSMGGMAAMAFAIDHPDALKRRVRAIVLVATAAHGIGYHRRLHPFNEWLAASPVWEQAVRRPRIGLVFVRSASGRTPRLAHVAAMRDHVLATTAASRQACLRALQRMDLREGLDSVDVPATVLVGSRDALTPPALSRALAARLTNSRIEVIPDAGHLLPFESPDRLTEVIAQSFE
ncbi:MAG: alpha/beta fold hydrolase, partial [Acidimicrobiales bacterium]